MTIECPSCGSEITIFGICVPPQLQCPHCDCVLRCDGDTIEIDRGVKTDRTMESLRNVGNDKPNHDLIRKWATEIVFQCDLAEIVDGGN